MIKIVDGDLFSVKSGIICHQCNCKGVMGSGVALQVKQKYPRVFDSYRKDFEAGLLTLGHVNFATTDFSSKNPKVIANMCAQDGYGYDGGTYTDYIAFQECLRKVVKFANQEYYVKPTIALPFKIGCDRGGADWDIIYRDIETILADFEVTIYKL